MADRQAAPPNGGATRSTRTLSVWRVMFNRHVLLMALIYSGAVGATTAWPVACRRSSKRMG